MCGETLDSIINNYDQLILLWEWSLETLTNTEMKHSVKSARIRSYSGPYSVRMWENTDQNNRHILRSES